MKKSLLLLAAAFLSMGTFAQTNLVENGDFEAWEGKVPTNWKTLPQLEMQPFHSQQTPMQVSIL